MKRHHCAFALLSLSAVCIGFAAHGAEAQTQETRRFPPAGISIPANERSELEAGAAEFGRQIEALRGLLTNSPAQPALLPDVQIYHKAVDWALRYDEFDRTNETRIARRLLEQGRERARTLAEGRAPWTTATGLVVRAYQSRIDGSVQPYG